MVEAEKDLQTEEKYYIDFKDAKSKGRALGSLMAARRCPSCQEALQKEALPNLEPGVHLKRIVDCCSKEPDYIVASMPLMEAVFRLLLAFGNHPMTLKEIHEALSERWTVSGFPKYLPIEMLEHVLKHDHYYGISQFSNEQDEG